MLLARLLRRLWNALIPARYAPSTSFARNLEKLEPEDQQVVLGNQFRSGL